MLKPEPAKKISLNLNHALKYQKKPTSRSPAKTSSRPAGRTGRARGSRPVAKTGIKVKTGLLNQGAESEDEHKVNLFPDESIEQKSKTDEEATDPIPVENNESELLNAENDTSNSLHLEVSTSGTTAAQTPQKSLSVKLSERLRSMIDTKRKQLLNEYRPIQR